MLQPASTCPVRPVETRICSGFLIAEALIGWTRPELSLASRVHRSDTEPIAFVGHSVAILFSEWVRVGTQTDILVINGRSSSFPQLNARSGQDPGSRASYSGNKNARTLRVFSLSSRSVSSTWQHCLPVSSFASFCISSQDLHTLLRIFCVS